MTDFPWTDEQVGYLRELFATDSHSNSEMASMLARRFDTSLTRNAVIGKLLRLGLQRGHNVFRPSLKPTTKPVAPGEPIALNPDDIPAAQRCSLLELTNRTCRFPYGDVGEASFFFCGDPTASLLDGQPYCPTHAAIAFRPGRAA